ncbi:hypothetical protein B7494_g6815 [Chlorociboria aeruginascens]|nr:hypothetical protein B7494_g6815 [Chlorociboria aeruginascens]
MHFLIRHRRPSRYIKLYSTPALNVIPPFMNIRDPFPRRSAHLNLISGPGNSGLADWISCLKLCKDPQRNHYRYFFLPISTNFISLQFGVAVHCYIAVSIQYPSFLTYLTRFFAKRIVITVPTLARLYQISRWSLRISLDHSYYLALPWFFQVLPDSEGYAQSISLNLHVKMAQNPDSSTPKNIIILGGSYGGISTAHYLLKHVVPQVPDKSSYQVIVVSASSQAMCRPACPRALISDDMFAQEKLFVNIPQAFEQYPQNTFRFIHGTATELDHANRTISIHSATSETEKVDFYVLVIATGASTPSPLLSLSRDEDFLRSSWTEFRKALPAAKSIVISGGGPTGIETAGELGEFLNGRAGLFSSKRANPEVAITVVTAGPQILPILRPVIAKKAEKYLAKLGVTVIKNTRVKTVEPHGAGTDNVTAKAMLTLEDGTTLDADLYIPATGTRPNTNFMPQSLLTANGHVDTNVSTLRVDKAGPRIYAVGDAASYARPAVHLILSAIPVLCANIKRDLLLASGRDESSVGEDRLFKEDTRETQMVPIGRSKGVGSAMGYTLPSFMVWLIKGRDYWLWTTGDLWSGKQWAKES